MGNTSFTIDVDGDLLASFTEAVQAAGKDPAQVLRDLMESFVRQDEWLREVREGLREADDPNSERLPHEQAMAEVNASLEAHIAPEVEKPKE